MQRGLFFKITSIFFILGLFGGCVSSAMVTENAIESDGRPTAETTALVRRSSFMILGDVQHQRSWSVDEVKEQFAGEIRTVNSTVGPPSSRQEITSTGIPLISLVRAAELIMEEPHRHHGFNHIVVLEAFDGYRSYYAFAELANQRENQALLVWEENGEPIPDDEAPFRLRDGPNRGAIYGITRIIIAEGNKLVDIFQ